MGIEPTSEAWEHFCRCASQISCISMNKSVISLRGVDLARFPLTGFNPFSPDLDPASQATR